MLRFHKFTIGSYWVSDYGCSDNKEQFLDMIKFVKTNNMNKFMEIIKFFNFTFK